MKKILVLILIGSVVLVWLRARDVSVRSRQESTDTNLTEKLYGKWETISLDTKGRQVKTVEMFDRDHRRELTIYIYEEESGNWEKTIEVKGTFKIESDSLVITNADGGTLTYDSLEFPDEATMIRSHQSDNAPKRSTRIE